MRTIVFNILLFVACFIGIKAQSIRFEYDLRCSKDTLSNNFQKFNTVLEFTDKAKKFYDMDVYKHDSILNNNGGTGYMSTGFDQNLLKLKSDQINQTYHQLYIDWFRLQSTDQFSWEITQEKKKEKGYKLQKAITNFGGRKWIAWFTEEIPIPEGPYKFSGLPGLIVEISDSKNHYHYELTKVTKLASDSNTINIIEKPQGKTPIDITLGAYNKMLLDYYNEPFKDLISSSNGFSYYDGFSKKQYTKVEELRSARIDKQKRIKKYYNPIELDKAVKYPD